MTKSKRSFPWFWIGLGLYTLALLTAIAVGLSIVADRLSDYEAGLPDKAAEAVFQQYFATDLTVAAEAYGGHIGLYESAEEYVAAVKETAGDDPLRYFEAVTADSDSHTYEVAAGDLRVGQFVLTPSEEKGKWILQTLTLTVKPQHAVTVTVWQYSTVYLNGVKVEESEGQVSSKPEDHPSDKHLALTAEGEKLAASPVKVTYKVEGLYQIPEITVLDKNGNPCEVTEKNGQYTASFPYDDSRVEEMHNTVFRAVEEYCKFINRLVDYEDVTHAIHRDSDFYRNLKRAAAALEWNRGIVDYEFDVEDLTQLYFYSDDVFSGLIHVEESVLGNNKRDWYTYEVDARVYFCRTKDGWRLYEMDFSMA